MKPTRNALGRGLGSLISMDDTPARGTSAINDIDLSQISPNPEQPRTTFDEDALNELAASIAELGIIQPLSLRKTGPDSYQIIAGERRYRAAKIAGLTSVPAYIRTANEAELTEMALIENIQREDLNAIEIAPRPGQLPATAQTSGRSAAGPARQARGHGPRTRPAVGRQPVGAAENL